MLESLRSYRCLIFDWDGTLADSAGSIVRCVQQTAKMLDLDVPHPERIRQGIGLGLKEQLQRLFPEPPEPDTFQKVFREQYFALRRNPVPALFQGVEESLRRWHGLGYELAVATGMGRRGLDETLDSLGLTDLFAATCTAEETVSKPDPAMLRVILKTLDCPVEKAIMVGDTTYDMDAAHALGMACVAVLSGTHSAQQLKAVKPTALIDAVSVMGDWDA